MCAGPPIPATPAPHQAAKSGLRDQLDKANLAFEAVVEVHHVAIGENAGRHGETLEQYKSLNANLVHLTSEVTEARRLLHPRGSEGLLQLRFKSAMFAEVCSPLSVPRPPLPPSDSPLSRAPPPRVQVVSLLDAASAVTHAPRKVSPPRDFFGFATSHRRPPCRETSSQKAGDTVAGKSAPGLTSLGRWRICWREGSWSTPPGLSTMRCAALRLTTLRRSTRSHPLAAALLRCVMSASLRSLALNPKP